MDSEGGFWTDGQRRRQFEMMGSEGAGLHGGDRKKAKERLWINGKGRRGF